jgi:ferredoxin
VKVVHDPDVCAVLGMCEMVEPEVFEISSDGALRILQVEPSEELRASVEAACDACPTGALRIEG